MSIKINKSKCVSCGKCLKVCPGNLICKDENNKAFIKYKRACWGCSACIKECKSCAISYYLEPDIGGCGTSMYTMDNKDTLEWVFQSGKGDKVITIDKKESNKY